MFTTHLKKSSGFEPETFPVLNQSSTELLVFYFPDCVRAEESRDLTLTVAAYSHYTA